jgi:capsular exopolysaccharide synthesis family protein
MDSRQSGQTLPAPVQPEGGAATASPQYASTIAVGANPRLAPGWSATPNAAALVRALRRRWLRALGIGMVASALAATAVLLALPARYVAETRFLLITGPGSAVDAGQDSHQEFAHFKELQKATILAPSVLAMAVHERVSGDREAGDLSLVRKQGNGIVEWMEHSLNADFKVAPDVMSAWLSGEDPAGLADLLNAIASAYLKENDAMERARRTERLGRYRESLKVKEQELGRLRAKLDASRQRDDPQDPLGNERQLQQARQDLAASKTALQNLEARLSVNQFEWADCHAKLKTVPDRAAPAEQIDDYLRTDDKAKSIHDQIKLVDLKILDITRKGADTTVVDRLKQIEKDHRAGLVQMLQARRLELLPEIDARYRARLKADLTEKIESADHKRAFLMTQIKELRDECAKLGNAIATLDALMANDPPDVLSVKDEIKSTESAVDRIRQNILALEVEGSNSRVSVQMPATPPTGRDFSRQIKLAGVAGFSGFALALFGVAIWELRSRRISMNAEVSHGLGLPVVGTLPTVPKRASAARQALREDQLREAVDGVRTMLLHAARTEPLRVVLVTSACGGEGKTSVAGELAASLARAWRKTLLIDGDLRNPAMHQRFDLPREPGLSEVLRGEVTVDDAIRPTSVSRLWVLPAGHWDSHAIQALAQDEVHTLIERLKGQFDFVVIDSSPVLPVADALLLAQHVDGVLFSILRDVSRMPEVFAAQERLAPLGTRVLGAVLIGTATDLSARACRYKTCGTASSPTERDHADAVGC